MRFVRRRTSFLSCAFVLGVAVASARAEAPRLVGMGDSIGEGVQSADASYRTQPASYLNWIAFKMGAPCKLLRALERAFRSVR